MNYSGKCVVVESLIPQVASALRSWPYTMLMSLMLRNRNTDDSDIRNTDDSAMPTIIIHIH